MRYNSNLVIYNRAYIIKRVLFDVLSIVLKQPSIDNILYILTYMSLIYNPRILIDVPNNILIILSLNPIIIKLE
jgi:hypothetical protein